MYLPRLSVIRSAVTSVFIYASVVATFLLACLPGIHAVPAPDIEQELTQPDGTRFKGRARGDEWFHYHETSEGQPIVQDETTKRWHYALPDTAGNPKASTSEVGKDAPPIPPWTPEAPAAALEKA